MSNNLLRERLLGFLVTHYENSGEAPAHIREFCRTRKQDFDSAVRPLVVELYQEDLLVTVIGNEYAWLTAEGYERAKSAVQQAQTALETHDTADLLRRYALALQQSPHFSDAQKRGWSIALLEMSGHPEALAALKTAMLD